VLSELNLVNAALSGTWPPIEIGQWYWATDQKTLERSLACVVQVGSNYAELRGVTSWVWRVHFNDWHTICELAEDPEAHIQQQIELHQGRVNGLMGKIKQLTASLGFTRGALAADSEERTTTAWAVAHSAENVQEHKAALVKAKNETLPQLFKEIEEEHKQIATWMRAGLMPMEAQSNVLQGAMTCIDDRIHTVELYAGLTEDIEKIRDGEPAPNDTKVSLMQRRHYMDEECLVDYEAGGMEFADIAAFESWLLATPARRERLFPFPRCVVVFGVRRHPKSREAGLSIWDFIQLDDLVRADRATFMYIRNGAQYFRMRTSLDFGEELLPDRVHDVMLGSESPALRYILVHNNHVADAITEDEYLRQQTENAVAKAEHNVEHAKWKAEQAILDAEQAALDAAHIVEDSAAKRQRTRRRRHNPWYSAPHSSTSSYVACTPDSAHYDEGLAYFRRAAMRHNRVAVVLQGLLDRSPVFHPHPPWQLWTAEGFEAGLDLVYDNSRALTPGDAPNFEAFRQRLNAQFQVGDVTIGQQYLWGKAEADKLYAREREDWRIRDARHCGTYAPYGNPGPGFHARPATVRRNRSVTFRWERERKRRSVHWDAPTMIETRFTCALKDVLNISAYTPGDYKQFYEDPRTRADYLAWAPLLLAAEDWHAERKKRGA